MNTETNTITCAHCGAIINYNAIEFDGKFYCDECIDEVSFVCDDCGERKPIAERNDVECKVVCDDCLFDKYTVCDVCGNYIANESIIYCNDDGRYICHDCLEDSDGYFTCEHCGAVHLSFHHNMVYLNDVDAEEWCDDCVERSTFYCEGCDRSFSDECEAEQGVCEFCASRVQKSEDIRYWSAPSGVRSYSYKPTPCYCVTEEQAKEKAADEYILLGPELEMEDHRNYGENADNDADYMNEKLDFSYCKHDGSLDDGIELVFHPASIEYFMSKKETLAEVFGEMIRKGYTSHKNGNCGLHVHVSLKALTKDNAYATCALARIVDNLWDELVCFSRRTEYQLDRWASRYDTKYLEFTEIVKAIKKYGRYTAVNMQNRHTVEIRIFRGTLNVNTFLATLQLVERLAEISTICYNADDADSVTWKMVTDCDYEELKAYCQKRFGTAEDEAEAEEEVSESDASIAPDFMLSEEEMHERNFSERTSGSFCVGDYVRLIHDNNSCYGISFNPSLQIGDIGIIRHINNSERIGVEFRSQFNGHNLLDHSSTRNGQWIDSRDLAFV